MLHSKKKTYVRKLRGVGLGLLCAQKSYLTFICCVKIVAVLNGLSHTSHVKWFSRSWSLTTWLRRLVSKNRWWRADNTITISSNSNQHYSWGAISGRTSLCIFLDLSIFDPPNPCPNRTKCMAVLEKKYQLRTPPPPPKKKKLMCQYTTHNVWCIVVNYS